MVTDLTYLNSMSGGAPEIVKEMITIFIDQAQEYVRDMPAHLASKDYNSLARLAHKAKSSISIMGMTDLATDLKTLELLAKEEKDVDQYPEYVNRFVKQCNQAIEELTETASKL